MYPAGWQYNFCIAGGLAVAMSLAPSWNCHSSLCKQYQQLADPVPRRCSSAGSP